MPLLSAKDYAAHRGVTAQAVSKAIKSGRLKESLRPDPGGGKKPRIDVELADLEWQKNSDPSKARGESSAPIAESANTPTRAFGLPAGDSGSGVAEPIDYQKERGRREHFLARIAEIELEEKLGRLVPADQVEKEWIAAASIARAKVMSIASKAKQRIPELTPAQVAILEAIQREALEDIANAGAAVEMEEATSGQAV